jgi:signal peptidase II
MPHDARGAADADAAPAPRGGLCALVRRRDRRSHFIFWTIALLGTLFDQATKIYVHDVYPDELFRDDPEKVVSVIPGVWGIHSHHNYGALAGLAEGHTTLLIVVSFLAMGVILWLFLSATPHSRLADAALGSMMAGAIGNQIDRLFIGSVRDFIHLLFIRWPIFNVADACLVLGVVLMLLTLILGDRKPAEKQAGHTNELQS